MELTRCLSFIPPYLLYFLSASRSQFRFVYNLRTHTSIFKSGYGVQLQFLNSDGVNTTGEQILSCWHAYPNGTCPFAFDNSTTDDDNTATVVSTADLPAPEEPMVVSVSPTDSPQDNNFAVSTAPTTAAPIPSSSTSNFGTLFLWTTTTTTTYGVFLAAVLSFA